MKQKIMLLLLLFNVVNGADDMVDLSKDDNSLNKSVYIYHGPGTSNESVMQTAYTLGRYLSINYKIKTLQHDHVISGDWIKDAALFLMPGGADLPYVANLTPVGNRIIKAYIESGGSFLGICAGAYYASNYVEFALGTELEVKGERELSLFPGTVKGPCLKPYDYRTNSGACAAEIQLAADGSKLKVFYNGGGFFVGAESMREIEKIARYTQDGNENEAAIIRFMYGKGRVILSGVHPEYDPEFLDSKDIFFKPIASVIKENEQCRIDLIKYLLNSLGLRTN